VRDRLARLGLHRRPLQHCTETDQSTLVHSTALHRDRLVYIMRSTALHRDTSVYTSALYSTAQRQISLHQRPLQHCTETA